MLIAARSSQDFACCARADHLHFVSAIRESPCRAGSMSARQLMTPKMGHQPVRPNA